MFRALVTFVLLLACSQAQAWQWVVTGYNGPLPKTEAETLAILKKYGGE